MFTLISNTLNRFGRIIKKLLKRLPAVNWTTGYKSFAEHMEMIIKTKY